MSTDKNCGSTYVEEYAQNEPCELKSADCVIYEGTIADLSLEENPTVKQVIDALVGALNNQSALINNLQQQIETT